MTLPTPDPAAERIELPGNGWMAPSPRAGDLWRIYSAEGIHIGAIDGEERARAFAASLAPVPEKIALPDDTTDRGPDRERIPLPGGMHFQRVRAYGDIYKLIDADGDSVGPQYWRAKHARAFAAALGPAPTPPSGRAAEDDPWRPIETAPETDREHPVDIWLVPTTERPDRYLSSPIPFRATNAWQNGSAGSGWTNPGAYNDRFRMYRATHWMPLPTPPASTQEPRT